MLINIIIILHLFIMEITFSTLVTFDLYILGKFWNFKFFYSPNLVIAVVHIVFVDL